MVHAHNVITRCIFYAMLLGFILWVTILMNASFSVRTIPVKKPYVVRIATFKLHIIEKVPIHDGYSLHISLERDLLWYGVSWFGAGLGTGLFWRTLQLKHNNEQTKT